MTIGAARIEVLRRMGFNVRPFPICENNPLGVPGFTWERNGGVPFHRIPVFRTEAEAWDKAWKYLADNCDRMMPQVLDAIEDATGKGVFSGKILKMTRRFSACLDGDPFGVMFGETRGKAAFALLEQVVQ